MPAGKKSLAIWGTGRGPRIEKAGAQEFAMRDSWIQAPVTVGGLQEVRTNVARAIERSDVAWFRKEARGLPCCSGT